MDFTLSADQTLIRDAVRGYCRQQYGFQARQRVLRSAGGFSRERWKTFGEMGWLGTTMPEDVGGIGGSAVDLAIILEEFGRCLALEPFVPCAVLAAEVVEAAGSREQRQLVLPPLIRGDLLVALAHAESGARGMVSFVDSRAAPQADGYALNGRKSLVLGGGAADLFVVTARTSGAADGRDGISAFLVRPDTPGLIRRTFRTVDGGQAAELLLDDVRVGRDDLVGGEGEAIVPLEDATDRAVVALCAEAVGAMDAVVTITSDFLKTRRAYGTTLSTFQALQHRLADMLTELELSRAMLFRALGALESRDRRARRQSASAAKALIGRSGRFVGSYGVQLHGGMGMSDDYIIGHLFKRLTVIETLFGNSDFHLAQFASLAEEARRPNALEAGARAGHHLAARGETSRRSESGEAPA